MSSIGRFSASAERRSSNSFVHKQFGIHTTESTESAVVESKQRRQGVESNINHNRQQNAKEKLPRDGPAEKDGHGVEEKAFSKKDSPVQSRQSLNRGNHFHVC